MVEEHWKARYGWLLVMAIATTLAVFLIQGDRAYGWLLGGFVGGAALMGWGRPRSRLSQEQDRQHHAQQLAQWQTTLTLLPSGSPAEATPEGIAALEEQWHEHHQQLQHQVAIWMQDWPPQGGVREDWLQQLQEQENQWDRQIRGLHHLGDRLLSLYRQSHGHLQKQLGEWERLLSDRQEEIQHYQQQIHMLQQLEQYAIADNMRLHNHNHRLKQTLRRRKQSQHYWRRQAVDLQELISLYDEEIRQLKQEQEELHQSVAQAYRYSETPPLLGEGIPPEEEEENSSQPLYTVGFGPDALKCLSHLATHDSVRYRKVIKTVEKMRRDLRNNSLHTHPYDDKIGPHGERMFEAYVEHRTPGGWRLFWFYGPGDRCLTIHEITPHP